MNTQTQRYLDPTNDSLFKKIFHDLGRLKEFINNILDLPEGYRIKEIEFIPVEQLPNIDRGKRSVFDLKVKDESGNWYIIEMQKRNESDYLKRVQYYSAHSYTQQLTAGITHKDLLPVVVISLMKTKVFDNEVPYISFHKMTETKTNKQYLFDFSYVFIELKKFKKDQLTNIADEWLHLFKCAEKEHKPPANIKSKKVLEAYHAIELHNLTPEEYDAYIRAKLLEDAEEIALAEHFEKGVEEGIEKGIAEEKIRIVKNLLVKNIDINTISEITGLSVEEIKELKE
ncbi:MULTISPECIES: Rpn family recombination-promoting nuclease/putative transposase [unclassified Rickettsia]|uniref:Rpn family recombination-promoting nuclease/putative transposase n=1 Tax=unclassified Rickettsia TaxID=114295 RepID=UPI003132D48F